MDELVRAIAAFGLRDDDPLPRPATEAWTETLGSIEAQKLTGLASAAADAGALPLDHDQRSELTDRHRRVMTWDLMLESRLLEVDDAFAAAGIERVVLKGPAVARAAYPDPAWRAFGDLDLLVRGEDFRRACRVLRDLRFERVIPEPRRGFDERFGKAAAHRSLAGEEVDLHRTLVLGPFGLWIRPGELFDRTVPFRIAGRTFRRLGDSAMFVHACLHAAVGADPPQLHAIRDVAQTMRLPGLRWDDVHAIGDRWRLTAAIQRGIELAARDLGLVLEQPAIEMLTASVPRAEIAALHSYARDRRRLGGTSLSTLRAIDGVRARGAYVRAVAFPSRTFLTGRYPGVRRARHVRRLATPLRWVVARLRAAPRSSDVVTDR